MLVASNFEFLKLDEELGELFQTANTAEEAFCHQDYETTLFKTRKVSEHLAKLVADRLFLDCDERESFNTTLGRIQGKLDDSTGYVMKSFRRLQGRGNHAVHELNSSAANEEIAEKSLKTMHYLLAWFMLTYVDESIKIMPFERPVARERYETAVKKLIYIQTADQTKGSFPLYVGKQKIGEGTVPADDEEADRTPNSTYLRELAMRRIKQYMTTAGISVDLGWVELAYRRSDGYWFHDYDVHDVLKRSRVRQASELTGQEWFEVDLETAKAAIAAVKEGRHALNLPPVVEERKIELRPNQQDAVDQTKKVFKKKNKMLWNAKMRFGKTLASLQLIKDMGFEKVLLMTHRPVVKDSWFEDFDKMEMAQAGYRYGSKNRGETIDVLKEGETPFIYFASIQLLRYGGGETNLSDYADVDWDLIIIDEAHEGTQTELSSVVMEALVKPETKILELSGTPFNLLDQYEEDQVYTWDYTMEQEAKLRWNLQHPDKPNPYGELPRVEMYTFEMKQKEKFADETKSFNFREFFRVDDKGELVYQKEVRAFLDQITQKNKKTDYPFSTADYRESLRHTLWLLPGVKEATAFEKLLLAHPIFGQEYRIVNVVKDGDNGGEATKDDLEKVREAIGSDPSQTKTITLTVRKLTTGVNVPEWTGVVFLSNTNSPMNYLQAAFRAQTPFSHEKLGKKEVCYVFDFAPDRALTVMAESAQINSGVGKKNTTEQTAAMTKLLNFMPILSHDGNGMRSYNVDKMLTQLKKVYAEKAVRSGFEDDSLYNDQLLTLTADDESKFNQLKGIVGTTNKERQTKVVINEQGLTDEEYETAEKAKKKKPRERSQKEKEALEKFKEAQKNRKAMISILRGVSIRIPMMIYGMAVDLDEDITIDRFIKAVDDQSWQEFMPKGFTKGMFRDIVKYYDPEVFIEAGRIIRRRAKSFDRLGVIERAENIAELFSTFKNPDKETVLTPWRVVNLQVTKAIGGLNFFDDAFTSMTTDGKPSLHWVELEDSSAIYQKGKTFLDINAKTGLYPLHAAMSLFQRAVENNTDSHFDELAVYGDILQEQIYAIAKTPMAKTITERTLAGYRSLTTNVRYIDDFSETIKTDLAAGKTKIEEAFGPVKFDVVIGNPPYQEETSGKEVKIGQQKPVRNVFHEFQQMADQLEPHYSCLIYPGGRWIHRSGKGMSEFGKSQINSPYLSKLIFYPDASEVFHDVAIPDGISIVFKDYTKQSDVFEYIYSQNNIDNVVSLNSPGEKLLTLNPLNAAIVAKIDSFIVDNELKLLSESKVINRGLFQIESDFAEKNPDKVELYVGKAFDTNTHIKLLTNDKAGKAGRATWFIVSKDVILVNQDLISKWKVVVSSANAGGQKRDNQLEILDNHSAFGRSRLALKAFDSLEEAENFYHYVKSYIIRFAFLMTDESITSLAKQVPDLLDYSSQSSLIDFSKNIDEQLKEKLSLTDEEYSHVVEFVDNFRKK